MLVQAGDVYTAKTGPWAGGQATPGVAAAGKDLLVEKLPKLQEVTNPQGTVSLQAEFLSFSPRKYPVKGISLYKIFF